MMNWKKRLRRIGLSVCFLGPMTFFFCLVFVLPFFSGIYYSFTEWNGIDQEAQWIGLKNFVTIFTQDAQFLQSFWFTLQFTIVTLVLANVLAFLFALALVQPIKSRNALRTAFFLPNVIGGVLLGFIWRFIFVNGFGTLGQMTNLSIFQMPWLGTPETGFWGIVLVYTWRSVGYLMIIYVANLLNIDKSLLEAARIDGAKGLALFRYSIFPLVMPAITVCLFLTLSWTFKSFDIVIALTHGGPFRSTETAALNIYLEVFSYNNYGLGAAKSFIYFLVVGIFTLTQVGLTKKAEVEA
jgi:raffinose/stachyose/melibiose transport system permease protein